MKLGHITALELYGADKVFHLEEVIQVELVRTYSLLDMP